MADKSYYEEAYDAVIELSAKGDKYRDQEIKDAATLLAFFIDDTESLMTGGRRRCNGDASPLSG